MDVQSKVISRTGDIFRFRSSELYVYRVIQEVWKYWDSVWLSFDLFFLCLSDSAWADASTARQIWQNWHSTWEIWMHLQIKIEKMYFQSTRVIRQPL